MSNPFQVWMQRSTFEQKNRLAALAKTTLGTLRQLAGGYRTGGKVRATPELARRIEEADAVMQHQPGLPEIKREDLCVACSACDLAKTARAAQRKRK